MLNLLSDRIHVSRLGSPLLLEQPFSLADGVNLLADRIRGCGRWYSLRISAGAVPRVGRIRRWFPKHIVPLAQWGI